MVRLAIINDNERVRKDLTSYFSGQNGFRPIIVAENVESFLTNTLNENIEIDIVLSDIPSAISSKDSTWTIKKKFPYLKVVKYTSVKNNERIFEAFMAGASGYLLKGAPFPTIKTALFQVMDGHGWMSPSIAFIVINYFKTFKIKSSGETLTSREIEIIHEIKMGSNNKEISENLFISVDTVKFHIKNIYGKFQVNSRVKLLKAAFDL